MEKFSSAKFSKFPPLDHTLFYRADGQVFQFANLAFDKDFALRDLNISIGRRANNFHPQVILIKLLQAYNSFSFEAIYDGGLFSG